MSLLRYKRPEDPSVTTNKRFSIDIIAAIVLNISLLAITSCDGEGSNDEQSKWQTYYELVQTYFQETQCRCISSDDEYENTDECMNAFFPARGYECGREVYESNRSDREFGQRGVAEHFR